MAESKQIVLIVDDDPELLQLFQMELRSEFDVISAHNGEEALVNTLLHRPDIVITDINMPDLNGWELCFILRQIPSTRFIPLVFLSSRSELPDRIKSLRLGADDFIAKPFSIDRVTSRMRAILNRVKNRQRVASGDAMEGEVNTLFIDVLEYLRATRRSGVIEFNRIDQNGSMSLHNGLIVEAQFEGLRDEEAVKQMLQIETGEISYKEKDVDPGQPVIEDWTGLIASFLPQD